MTVVVAFSSCLDVAAIEMEMGAPLDFNGELQTVRERLMSHPFYLFISFSLFVSVFGGVLDCSTNVFAFFQVVV